MGNETNRNTNFVLINFGNTVNANYYDLYASELISSNESTSNYSISELTPNVTI